MKTFTLVVAFSSFAAFAPLAVASSFPSCASVTDSTTPTNGAGLYLSNTDGWSVWSEANGVPGLQTADCVDAMGQYHHADVEQFASQGGKQVTCLTSTLCFFT